MRKILILIITAAAVAFLFACSGNVPPVPVIGSHADMSALAGEWEGTYEVTDGNSRRGDIYLRLDAERDTARGLVLMSVWQSQLGLGRDVQPAPAVPYGESISIRFVRVNGNVISGSLDPYKDPYCGCTLTTTFTGRLIGNSIDGKFSVRHSDSLWRETGTWRAVRKAIQ